MSGTPGFEENMLQDFHTIEGQEVCWKFMEDVEYLRFFFPSLFSHILVQKKGELGVGEIIVKEKVYIIHFENDWFIVRK